MLLGMKFGVGMNWHGFDRAKIATRVKAPILLLHGDQDPVSPFRDAVAVDQASQHAATSKIEGAGHNNIWTDPVFREVAIDAVGSFLIGEIELS